MSAMYPCPEETNYVEPTTTPEIILDEMRLYPQPLAFREGLEMIANVYKNTPLLQGLGVCAHVMNEARASIGHEVYPYVDPAFYAASVLAVHSALRPAKRQLRQQILHTNFLHQPDQEMDNETFQQWRTSLVQRLGQWRLGGYVVSFEEQADEFQEAVVSAAAHMYHDQPNVGHIEDDFVSGYMFASNVIWGASLTPYLSSAPKWM